MANSNRTHNSRFNIHEEIDRELRRETRQEDLYTFIWGLICLSGFAVFIAVIGISSYHYGRDACSKDEGETLQQAKFFFNHLFNLTRLGKNTTLEIEGLDVPEYTPPEGGEYDN